MVACPALVRRAPTLEVMTMRLIEGFKSAELRREVVPWTAGMISSFSRSLAC